MPGERASWVPGIALWRTFVEGEWAVRRTLGVRAAARVIGPYVPFGDSGVGTDPYTLVEVGASARVGERFIVDLCVTNVLDTVYPAYRSTGFVAPGAPQPFRIGVRLVED